MKPDFQHTIDRPDLLTPEKTVDCRFGRVFTEALDFIMEYQLLRTDLWRKFADLYRIQPDAKHGWSGEYWGKMMRGATWVYAYSHDEKLYAILKESVLQLIGNAEHEFLASMNEKTLRKRVFNFMAQCPVAVIFTTGLTVFPEFIEAAMIYAVPILSTQSTTSYFTAALIGSLSLSLAPRITRHGVLVEVYGEGILISGESGIGKSETAIELVKRGHRLIADDAVDIRKVSAKSLVGRAPSSIRHYAELRGVGIIDVCRLFGMGAVKELSLIHI